MTSPAISVPFATQGWHSASPWYRAGYTEEYNQFMRGHGRPDRCIPVCPRPPVDLTVNDLRELMTGEFLGYEDASFIHTALSVRGE